MLVQKNPTFPNHEYRYGEVPAGLLGAHNDRLH
jgi:hypothetical protein